MTIKKIACCIDFSENAARAFDRALEMAEKFQAKLYVVHVLPPVVNPVLADMDLTWPDAPKKSLILKVEERIEREYGGRIGGSVHSELVVLDGHVLKKVKWILWWSVPMAPQAWAWSCSAAWPTACLIRHHARS